MWLGLLAALISLPIGSVAQNYNFPLQRDIMMQVEKSATRDSGYIHMGAKPIKMSRINVDSMDFYGTDRQEYYFRVEEILLSEHLIKIKKKDFEVMVDPLFNFEYGDDFADSLRKERPQKIHKNTRGLRIRGTIADKVSFETSFYENLAYYPRYASAVVNQRGVAPGFGRVKFGDLNYDFAMASGVVIVAPTDFVTIQYGHDKNFIGHGYRSLLLSDNSFNYPHLKLTWNVWKNRIQYTSVFGKVESLNRIPAGETPEAIFKPKGFSYNYLSVMPFRFLEIGLFESFVWKMYDQENGRTPFNVNSINPVIGVNTAVHGLNHQNNGILGLNLRLQLNKHIQFYGQVMTDDLANNKYGYQFGAKWFDILPNLELQAEFNRVTPFTYGTANPLQSYTHNNEFFAHPMGAGFYELAGFVNYRWRRFFGELKMIWAGYQQDYRPNYMGAQVTHFGKDILKPETLRTENEALNPANHMHQDLRLSYVINPSYNFMINAGVSNRHVYSDFFQQNTTYIYVGFRTYIHNQYFDF